MKMRYVPPLIYAHRVYYMRGEKQVDNKRIAELFGEGAIGSAKLLARWTKGSDILSTSWDPDREYHGAYVGFRNEDDQMLFYMTFEGN